jgi:hypothetical protein
MLMLPPLTSADGDEDDEDESELTMASAAEPTKKESTGDLRCGKIEWNARA